MDFIFIHFFIYLSAAFTSNSEYLKTLKQLTACRTCQGPCQIKAEINYVMAAAPWHEKGSFAHSFAAFGCCLFT